VRILCVSAQALFPETRFGGAKRLYYLAKALDANADLDLIHLDGCDEVRDPATFSPPFRRSLFLPRESLTSFELGPVIPEASKAVRRGLEAVRGFVGETRYDATLLCFPSALYFLERDLVPHPGKIAYLEDDLHLERLRHDASAAPRLSRRLLKRARFLQTRGFYRRNLRRVSAFLCISPQEAEIARREWGTPTPLIGYGIPLEDYPVLPPPRRGHVLGFIGNYRHLPNLDAARWLAETLFPAVLERAPDARLVLCGAGFPDALRARCAANPSIDVLDEVEDLAEFYARISVFVNPLREGRGLRTKVVEAAAYGRPVVSTPLGAEGLEGFELGLFETPAEFTAGVLALDDPETAERAVRRNRAETERLFSLDAVGRRLLRLLGPEEAAPA
jgi:glycosyltransferase involved in cell wall biosynthesis